MYRPAKLLECAATILAGMLANPHIDPQKTSDKVLAKEAIQQAKTLMELSEPNNKTTIDDDA